MRKTQKLVAKLQDARIERTYMKYGQGVQINVLDITKVFAAGRAAIAAGQDLDDAIQVAIAQLRRN